MRRIASSTSLALAIVGVAAIVVGSLLIDRSPDTDLAPPSAWAPFAMGGSEVEQYADFGEMAAAADGVVIARVTGVALSRTIQGDAAEDVVPMIRVDLAVESVLAGTAVPSAVALELIAPDVSVDAARERAAKMDAERSQQPVLVFLRRKELGYHRPVNSLGLWEESAGVLTAPLALPEDATAFLAGTKARSFADMVAVVAGAAPAA